MIQGTFLRVLESLGTLGERFKGWGSDFGSFPYIG